MSVCDRSPVSTSSASSSSSLRSRASSISRSSISGGSSIEKTRKSPWSSISTVACRDEPGIFLYAARSASSSADTRVPLSMPFSRSMSRTASTISWLISLPFVDQVGPDDCVVRDVDGLVSGVDRDGAFTRDADFPVDAVARVGSERHASADDVPKVSLRSQRLLEARRRDVYRILAQVLAEHVRHPLAERVVDSLGVVDVDRESIRAIQLHGKHLRARHCPLYLRCDLPRQLSLFLMCCCHRHKKWARRPISQTARNVVFQG